MDLEPHYAPYFYVYIGYGFLSSHLHSPLRYPIGHSVMNSYDGCATPLLTRTIISFKTRLYILIHMYTFRTKTPSHAS